MRIKGKRPLKAKIEAPKQAPEMSKGTLLKTFRKRTLVYSKPSKSPRAHTMGIIAKGENVMSIGEFVTGGTHTWVKVMTSIGPGWIRIKDVKGETPADEVKS